MNCALLAREAGYDGVEIMGSEGYLLNQFLAPRTNKRTDAWGGTPEKRRRMPVEIVRRTRAALGPDFIIDYRMSMADYVDGGQSWDEIVALAIEVEAAGATLINSGIGWHEARVPTIVTSVPRAAFASLAGRLKAAVKVPVVVNGEIWNVQDAQAAVAQSGCHTLMLGRGIVARPALARSILAAMGTAPDSIAQPGEDWTWQDLGPLMHAFWQVASTRLEQKQQAGRVKQWLNLLRRHYPEAQVAFDEMRTLVKPSDVDAWIRSRVPQT